MAKGARGKQPAPVRRPQPEVDLWEFLDNHQRPLSVFGVFVALTIFSASLPIKTIGYFLSVLFLLSVVIIAIEFTRKFVPSRNASVSLYLFQGVMLFATLLLSYYLVIHSYPIWRPVHLYVLAVLAWIPLFVIAKWAILNNLSAYLNTSRTRGFRSALAIVAFFVVILLSFGVSYVIATLVSPPFTSWYDPLVAKLSPLLP